MFAAISAEANAAGHVSLGRKGTFSGQILGTGGKPLASSLVTIRQGNNRVVRTFTNSQGRFTASGLRPGKISVSSAGGSNSVVGWSPGTAPPVAQAAPVFSPSTSNRGGSGFERRVERSGRNFDDHISLNPPKPPASGI